jgi:phosphoribosylanthranilate isomerase
VEEAGATHLGVVHVPGSPRFVTEDRAREIGAQVSIPFVLVVAGLEAEAAARAAGSVGADVIQRHGDEPEAVVQALRERGGWELWKVVRVRDRDAITAAATRYGDLVDLLLLDGWHPRALGGTGTGFPWSFLREVRAELPTGLRIGVAGGLTPENVAEAVTALEPDLVDVSSGVERSPGIKDPEGVRTFVLRAQGRRGV